jgi:hypothetical protein
LLQRGQIQPIVPGNSLIHSVFHLDTPSVTLVVRTHADIEHQPQLTYVPPGLAINPMCEDISTTRRVQMCAFLETVGSPLYDQFVSTAIGASDLYGCFRLLEHLTASSRGQQHIRRWSDVARQRHGEYVDVLMAALAERKRWATIRAKRNVLKDTNHRFLLALLMNVPRRSQILALVGERFPGANPKDLMERWAFEMAYEISGLNFGDIERAAFRVLLDGVDTDEAVTRLISDCRLQGTEEESTQVAAACLSLRSSPLFARALAEGP